ncbi:PREDICTED: epidermal growth factor receptor kinase substrate 8-like protein 1 [Priapulus caudatus]|uniref:Epidermal growth factor receptor kinase substrate 8-like protein 1 n=1 Tax=Priapulus caudatus TaxID=37621 RepID=A0ABM1DQ85_PRICU|nr:PREDICTED: epidermal growth factor receptor kinase substrate 8-like protein 1 [Priapulus caudatus]XP_014662107.1 PREDICTED: epidermal growth factor receptor kinase substrate 8-like protein 1 [Priapulus caudatus]
MPGVSGAYEWDDRHSRSSGYDPYMRRTDVSPTPRAGYYHDSYGRTSRGDDAASSRSHEPYRESHYRREEQYSADMMPQQRVANGTGTTGYTSSDQHSIVSKNDDGLVYTLDHLATFSVGHSHGLLWPADGIRKLRMMESSSGIWPQRMLMRLERKFILICNPVNGDPVEEIPLSMLQEPTAFVTHEPKEDYNNMLVFTVQGDKKNATPSEMHIFQCLAISAQEIQEEIKRLKAGKRLKGHGYHPAPIPPAPSQPPPDPPINGMSSAYNSGGSSRMQQRMTDSRQYGSVVRDFDADSLSSDTTERDVVVLNHCFDDVERFIAKLQQASAAYRELERRRKSRKNKKKSQGDGMLAMRAQPPPEEQFADVFQKFKLAFNLLAKLKNQIHDPNAPELIHFLFTPLALIVDACRDSRYGANLPARVVAPLLSARAIDMLLNCLTSKEAELWESLGESWTVPRHLYKGYVHPYHPVFADGWSPAPVEYDDRERSHYSAANTGPPPQLVTDIEVEDRHQYSRQYDDTASRYSNQPQYAVYTPDPRYEQDRYERQRHSSDSRYDDRYEQKGGSISDYRPVERARESARYDDRHYERQQSQQSSQYDPPPVQVLPAHMSAKQPVMNETADMDFDATQARFLKQLRQNNLKIFEVTYDRVGKNEKELTVSKGEYLEIIDDNRNWWKGRNAYGKIGHIPYTILKPYVASDGYNYPEPDRDYHKVPSPSLPTAPAAPLPPTPPPVAGKPPQPLQSESYRDYNSSDPSTTRAMPNTIKPARSDIDLLNDELNERLNHGGYKMARAAPNVYIDARCSSHEVQEWLQAKAFKPSICRALEGHSAAQLFVLKPAELEQICGREEGKRLASQLEVQKNISGFKTMGSRELEMLLKQRRDGLEEYDPYEYERQHQQGEPHGSRDIPGARPQDTPDDPQDSGSDSDIAAYGTETMRDMLRAQRKRMKNRALDMPVS